VRAGVSGSGRAPGERERRGRATRLGALLAALLLVGTWRRRSSVRNRTTPWPLTPEPEPTRLEIPGPPPDHDHRRVVLLLAGLSVIFVSAAVALVVLLVRSATSPTVSTAVSPPVSPSSYTLPRGATLVSDSAGLASALAAGATAVVLADGVYSASSPFLDEDSTSLYAEHLGAAVLTAGLVVGGSAGVGGAVIQGLAFDVTDPAATFQDSELNVWGASGAGTQVLDSTFEGNRTIAVGLLASNPSGLVAERLSFTDFTDDALRASDNVPVAYGASTPLIESISDIAVNGVSRGTPGASNGTGEAGLWIGEPVAQGVRRIAIRNCAWSGIETANNAWNTTFSDLDIDMSGGEAAAGVGVYLEHFSINDVFTNFLIRGARDGFNAEWNDGTAGGEAAQRDTIENGTIDASGWTLGGPTVGVYLDAGTSTTTILNVTFAAQTLAAIDAYENIGVNTFNGNAFKLAPGAVALSTGRY
jgi:hypothetical protein